MSGIVRRLFGEQMSATLQLFWNAWRVAIVNDVAWDDFPWATGRLTEFSVTPELREALEWLARMTEVEDLEDPPFDESLLDGWRVQSSDGREREISAPIIDLEAVTATWR